MATTINADTSTGGAIVTGDASGVLALQAAGSTQVTINGSGVVLANPLPVGSGGTGATSLSGLTVGTATSLAGGSNGTIPYQSASGTTQMLAVGTAGQVLQTNGVGAPTWVTPGGGSWVFLSTVTASGSATADIENTFDSTYDMYVIVANSIFGTVNNNLYARMKIGGTYIETTSYRFATGGINSTSGVWSYDTGNSQERIPLTQANPVSNTAGNSTNFLMYIPNPSSTTSFKTVFGQVFGGDNNNDALFSHFVGYARGAATSALTGVRIYSGSGNITGTFRLYGIKKS